MRHVSVFAWASHPSVRFVAGAVLASLLHTIARDTEQRLHLDA